MSLLLIIADDFTGALDTGVQFAARGIPTKVVVDTEVDFAAQDTEVLVVDTETRHLPADNAYAIVYALAKRAMQAGIRYLYKKTDSALRGNIGAELAALLAASGCRQLPFLPAFPQMKRITKNGVHYIDGTPVTDSPFGRDPFEPVTHAEIAALIAAQTDCPTHSFAPLTDADPVPDTEGILIFDAEHTEELTETGKQLIKNDLLHIMAGCAGFGASLPELLNIASHAKKDFPEMDQRLLVVCGSVNPITLAQLDRAEHEGFSRLRLTPRQKLTPDYWQSADGQKELLAIEDMLKHNPHCIIETNDARGNQLTAGYAAAHGLDLETVRVRIAGNLGLLVGTLFSSPYLGTLLLTGGDTLLQCMNCLGVSELEPVCELAKGVVLAKFTYQYRTRYIITKSGGFGQENLLTTLASKIGGKS